MLLLGQSLVLRTASAAPTGGGGGFVGESLKALKLISLACRVMLERALDAAEQRVVHGVRRRASEPGEVLKSCSR